jgi:hypothetical protein
MARRAHSPRLQSERDRERVAKPCTLITSRNKVNVRFPSRSRGQSLDSRFNRSIVNFVGAGEDFRPT